MDPSNLIDELIARGRGHVARADDKDGPTGFGISRAMAGTRGYAGDTATLPVPPPPPFRSNSTQSSAPAIWVTR